MTAAEPRGIKPSPRIKRRKGAHQKVRRFVFPPVAGFPSVRQIFRRFPEFPQQFCYYFPFHAPFISCFFEIGIAGRTVFFTGTVFFFDKTGGFLYNYFHILS
ncbi:MAG: hypothetical protein LBK62_07105 [Treponema sp.]|jgi:hypothetical protein|nr:hypothetical protein [Treponema sp.]